MARGDGPVRRSLRRPPANVRRATRAEAGTSTRSPRLGIDELRGRDSVTRGRAAGPGGQTRRRRAGPPTGLQASSGGPLSAWVSRSRPIALALALAWSAAVLAGQDTRPSRVSGLATGGLLGTASSALGAQGAPAPSGSSPDDDIDWMTCSGWGALVGALPGLASGWGLSYPDRTSLKGRVRTLASRHRRRRGAWGAAVVVRVGTGRGRAGVGGLGSRCRVDQRRRQPRPSGPPVPLGQEAGRGAHRARPSLRVRLREASMLGRGRRVRAGSAARWPRVAAGSLPGCGGPCRRHAALGHGS